MKGDKMKHCESRRRVNDEKMDANESHEPEEAGENAFEGMRQGGVECDSDAMIC